jgi:hypothetical protein
MKKLMTAIILLFAVSRAQALQVGDMTVTGNLYADQLNVSTFNTVAQIRYQDGSVQTTALQSTGSIVFIQSTQTITGAKTFDAPAIFKSTVNFIYEGTVSTLAAKIEEIDIATTTLKLTANNTNYSTVNTTQTITGGKTFGSTVVINNDLMVNGTSYHTGNIDMLNRFIVNLSTPASDLNAVNKVYADNLFKVVIATKPVGLASTSSAIWTNLVSTISFTLPSGNWSVQGNFNGTFSSANGNVVAYFRMVINNSEITGASNIANQSVGTRSSHINLASYETLTGGTYNIYVDWSSPNGTAITQDPSVFKRILIVNAMRSQ